MVIKGAADFLLMDIFSFTNLKSGLFQNIVSGTCLKTALDYYDIYQLLRKAKEDFVLIARETQANFALTQNYEQNKTGYHR